MESLYLLLTLVLGAIGALVLLYRQVNFWSRKGIPHLTPLPILGNNYPLFLRRISVNDYFAKLYNQFPNAKYFGIMDFCTPVVMIRDPELIKEVCVKNFEHFLDHKGFVNEEMDPIFGKNVFALRGERWKEMRNTLSPSFTATKMKIMFELIEKCARDFTQYFLDHPEQSESINSKDAFTRYTNDVIATAAFGISVNSLQDKENEFYARGKDVALFASAFRILKFIVFRLCPKLMRLIGEPFLSRGTNRFFRNIVQDTVTAREENNIRRPDMIHLLMEARDKDNGVNLSIDDIIAQAFIFFLAGFDTSSTLMCFLAQELVLNPKIQERLREEVDSFTENEGDGISYETLSKMKYMDMVISEALRKYPPAPATDRLCVKKYTLPKPTPESRECTIEPNDALWIPIYALHHDPKYFPNPEKFDPERFSDENKDNINPYTYLPFGVGPRKCIGNRFALMETKVLFAYILKSFVMEKTEKTLDSIEFEKNIIVTIKGGFWIKFSKRKY